MVRKKLNLFVLLLLLVICLVRGQPVEAKAAYKVGVDLSSQLVQVYQGDELVRLMVCSTGAAGSETPEGTFAIQNKGYMFTTEEGVSAKYYTSFKGWGKYMFHTILYDRQGNRQLVTAYKKLGRPASHGCIRLNVHDAKWIQANLPQGTPVKIYHSSAKGMWSQTSTLKYNNQASVEKSAIRFLANQPYVRASHVATLLGANLDYADGAITLAWQGKTLQYKLSEPYVTVNGDTSAIATAPQLFYEGSYLPLKSLCAALDLVSDLDGNAINLYSRNWLPIYFKDDLLRLDTPPVLRKDSLYIPARSLAQQLGYQVHWDATARNLTLATGDTLVPMPDMLILNNQAYVRLRTLTETLGYRLSWETNKVIIK